jgi:hypothetical protein
MNHENVSLSNVLCKQNACREAIQLNKQRNDYLSSDPSSVQGLLHFTSSTVKLVEHTGNTFYAAVFSDVFPTTKHLAMKASRKAESKKLHFIN